MERLTIGDLFDRVALGGADGDALVFPDHGVQWSYRETRTRVTLLAKAMMGLGVDAGDHVAIWAGNRPEWVLIQLAVAKLGGVLVPIPVDASALELSALLVQSDASTLFLSGRSEHGNQLDLLTECCPQVATARPGRLGSRRFPALKRLAFLGGRDDLAAPGIFSWADVLSAAAGITDHLLRCRQEGVDPGDPVLLLYDEVGADPPRGAELTHLNLVNNAFYAGECMRLTRRDRLCVPVPFASAFGCVLGTLAAVGRGAAMVVPSEHFDPGKTLAAVANERCTALHGEPRMFVSELHHPTVITHDFSALRTGIIAGGACSVDLMHQIVERLRLHDITVAYGRSEASAVITQTRIEDSLDLRATTVGRALPHVEVRIVDPKTGVEVPRGAEGELCCRGYLVMRGYYNMPEATAAVIGPSGWLRTGDLAVMDQHGYCAIVGKRPERPHRLA